MDLLTGNFTILCFAVVICILFGILSYVAYLSDKKEINAVSTINYFQEKIAPHHPVYALALKIEDCFLENLADDQIDFIFRLRGSEKDSPLILYRDENGENFGPGRILNLGFSFPYEIGSVLEIDIAGDNDISEETDALFSFSDLFVRKLPRQVDVLRKSKLQLLAKNSLSPFEALSNNIRTWASAETLTGTAGVGVMGISIPEIGRSQTVRARDVALTLTMQEESPTLKKKSRTGFRALHYIWSQTPRWHDAWSDYSKLDHVMVMTLDLLAMLVVVSCSYAYALEKLLGFEFIITTFTPSFKSAIQEIDKFDLFKFVSDINRHAVVLLYFTWLSLICSCIIIPLSIVWCRLFRLIGGKGFEKALELALPPLDPIISKSQPYYDAPPISAAHLNEGISREDNYENVHTLPSIMIRTLECRSTHTTSCVTSSRRLRLEPLIANCSPDHITARSLAYIRTKMTRLRDEISHVISLTDSLWETPPFHELKLKKNEIQHRVVYSADAFNFNILSGLTGLKHPDVLHESHTQSTDAPQMPPLITTPDGSGDIIRTSRYCERLVQQGPRHIRDNSIIAECFEVAPHVEDGPGEFTKHKEGPKAIDESKCCQKRCCRFLPNRANESLSNVTFFTEEDAVSLREMVEQFSSNNIDQATAKNTEKNLKQNQIKGKNFDQDWNNQEYDEVAGTPEPSANSLKKGFNKLCENIKPGTGILNMENKRRSSRRGIEVVSQVRNKRRTEMTTVRENDVKNNKGKKKGVRFNVDEKPNNKKNTKNQSRSNISTIESKPGESVPTISAGPKSLSIYNPVGSYYKDEDWKSAKSKLTGSEAVTDTKEGSTPVPRHAPFKSNAVKISVFIFLLVLQLVEIYFVTAFEMEENSFTRPGASEGRMHAALLTSIFCILWYFLFTIHLIAIVSLLVERIRVALQSKERIYDSSSSQASYHPLQAFS